MAPRIALVNDHRWIAPRDPDRYAQNILTEDALVSSALVGLGWHVERVAWSDPAVDWSAFDVALIRQTWDYFQRFDEWQRWLDRVSVATRLVNPAGLVRWNSDKRYLLELARAGVPCVPSRVWTRGSDPGRLAEHLQAAGWTEAVIKPVVSGGGRETWRVAAADADAFQSRWARLVAAEDMLLQPFIPEILDHGELSLIVIDGHITHAVRKRAAAGEFRVQDDHGGTVEAADAPPQLAAFASQCLAACPERACYARIDLVESADGPLLMELELIEPELFLRFHPLAAARLAAALDTHRTAQSSTTQGA